MNYRESYPRNSPHNTRRGRPTPSQRWGQFGIRPDTNMTGGQRRRRIEWRQLGRWTARRRTRESLVAPRHPTRKRPRPHDNWQPWPLAAHTRERNRWAALGRAAPSAAHGKSRKQKNSPSYGTDPHTTPSGLRPLPAAQRTHLTARRPTQKINNQTKYDTNAAHTSSLIHLTGGVIKLPALTPEGTTSKGARLTAAAFDRNGTHEMS